MKKTIKYPKYLKVEIKAIDYRESTGYMSNENCPLARALKRMGYIDPVVGSYNVDFYQDGVRYIFDSSKWPENVYKFEMYLEKAKNTLRGISITKLTLIKEK